jgi:lysozyme family protein
MNIQTEIDALIKREGGFVNHPAGKDGPTNMGITKKTLTFYLARDVSLDEIKNLSKQTARDIYYTNYYINAGINDLPELIQPVLFDMVANSGKRGIKILQEALFNHGYYTARIDGRIGPITIKAAHEAVENMGADLIKTLVRRRVIFYENLVKHDDTQRVFLAGWIARAESFSPTEA